MNSNKNKNMRGGTCITERSGAAQPFHRPCFIAPQRRNEGLPIMQRGHYYSKSEFAKTSSEKLLTFILIFSVKIL